MLTLVKHLLHKHLFLVQTFSFHTEMVTETYLHVITFCFYREASSVCVAKVTLETHYMVAIATTSAPMTDITVTRMQTAYTLNQVTSFAR